MANPALGTKRICAGCAAKFYDLGKEPIVCPTCETVFVIPKAAPPRGGRAYAPRSAYDPSAQVASPMGTLKVKRVLAAGQSQSADKLYDYVTQVQPTAGVIDGFLIHGGGSKSWATPPAVPWVSPCPTPTAIGSNPGSRPLRKTLR